jgi:hypothetical protein
MGTSVSPWTKAALTAAVATARALVGQCRFTLSKHVLKAPMVSALEAPI